MGKPYSQDLRERVIAAVDTGTGAYVAAPLFQSQRLLYLQGFDPATHNRRSNRARSGGGPKPELALHDDALRERIAAEPDITLAELQAWLLAERKVKVSVGCLWNRLNFIKLSLKKNRSELPSRIGQMWPKRGMSGV